MTPEVIKTFIQGVVATEIAKLLNGGNLSPMHTDCEGKPLCSTTEIVACAALADLIVEHIVNDKILGKLVTTVEETEGGFLVKYATGEEAEFLLDNVLKEIAIEDSVITITLADGTEVTLDLTGQVKSAVDDTIEGDGTTDNPLKVKNPLPEPTGDEEEGDHLVMGPDGKPLWETPPPCYVPIKNATGNFTLAVDDNGMLVIGNGRHINISDTIEYPIGFRVDIRGAATIDPQGAVTMGSIDNLKSVVTDGGATLIKVSDTDWWLAGALE